MGSQEIGLNERELKRHGVLERVKAGVLSHRGHRSLGLRHEVDVLDCAFLERDGSVGVVVTDRGRDQEPAWQLCVQPAGSERPWGSRGSHGLLALRP